MLQNSDMSEEEMRGTGLEKIWGVFNSSFNFYVTKTMWNNIESSNNYLNLGWDTCVYVTLLSVLLYMSEILHNRKPKRNGIYNTIIIPFVIPI